MSSEDGLDEFSVSGATRVVELSEGKLDEYDVAPEQLGLSRHPDGAVGAGTPDENAAVVRRVLEGDDGPERGLAVMNAAAAIYVAGSAGSLEEGARKAEESIDSGAAREVVERFVDRTRELAGPMSIRLEQFVDAARQAVERRKGEVPLVEARAGGRRPRRGPPVHGGALPARAPR